MPKDLSSDPEPSHKSLQQGCMLVIPALGWCRERWVLCHLQANQYSWKL